MHTTLWPANAWRARSTVVDPVADPVYTPARMPPRSTTKVKANEHLLALGSPPKVDRSHESKPVI